MSICIKVWFCGITPKVSSSISNSIKDLWIVLKIKYTNGRIGGRRLLQVEFWERGFLAGNCSSSSLMRLTQFIMAHSKGWRCSEITDTEFTAEIACCWNLKFKGGTEVKKGGGLWFADNVQPIVGLRNVADFRFPHSVFDIWRLRTKCELHTLQVSGLLNPSLSYNCPAKHNAICAYF